MIGIKTAHISPMAYVKEAQKHSDINLVLAHLIGKVDGYVEAYRDSNKYTIMDNGAFELGEPYEPERLLDLGRAIGANCLVLPDYPGEESAKTREAALKWAPIFKREGFDVMFVPQSEKGDLKDYLRCWDWALKHKSPSFDLIGCSILGAPNALPNIPRVFARYEILKIIHNKWITLNRVHMLGMLDNVHEIAMVKPFSSMINSWDTSAAAWYGHRGLRVQDVYEKLEDPVDFSIVKQECTKQVIDNMEYINRLCKFHQRNIVLNIPEVNI